MTDEQIIVNLVKENLELKSNLNIINDSANQIHCVLYKVGGGLNDNILEYDNKQMKELFEIGNLAKTISNHIPNKILDEE